MVDEEFANLQLVRLFTSLRVRPEARPPSFLRRQESSRFAKTMIGFSQSFWIPAFAGKTECVNDESFVEPLILSSDQGRESRFIGLVEGRVFG